MKTLLLTLLTLLTTATLWAQAPQRISYQSIIRDANNVVVASSPVGIKISVLRGTATGTAVYVETHPITTNANGLVSLNIGEGTAITGSFEGIDWSNGPYLIQTATDPTGGTDFSIIGIAPLNSVPYALNAANASVATTLAGTLAIASGGTGATTATAARAALGLENVDNTSDANKPVSTAAQTSLATKVDKVTGKELSTNDYSTAEKAKLAAITGSNTGDQDLSALATTAVVATKASTAELATGLALKANATDVTTSLATKVDKVTGKELSTNDYSTAEKTKLAAITGNNTGDQVNIAGNAATAAKLQATVTINGIAFDGSANVTIPATGAVPYTGATQAVDLGAYDLKLNGLTMGRGAGNVSTNTAVGNGALQTNATGGFNTSIGSDALKMNTGSYNIAVGSNALKNNIGGDFNTAMGFGSNASHTSGSNNASFGTSALASNTGSGNTAIGSSADVYAGISNATAVGFQALAAASNTIQLGNTSVINVKTSGTLTAGAVTYPNTVGSNGQVLTTDGLGAASWASAPTYSIGLNPALGGYVFYVTPDGKHGLVAETIDQFGEADVLTPILRQSNYGRAQDSIVDPAKHSIAGRNFADWRLPSRFEMLLMYSKRTEIGNFETARYYMTSTNHEFIELSAVFFQDGSTRGFPPFNGSALSNLESARAVRSF